MPGAADGRNSMRRAPPDALHVSLSQSAAPRAARHRTLPGAEAGAHRDLDETGAAGLAQQDSSMVSSRPHQSRNMPKPDQDCASRQWHHSQQIIFFFPATGFGCRAIAAASHRHSSLAAASHRHSLSRTGPRPIGGSKGIRRSALSCAFVAFVFLAGLFLHPVQAQPAAPSQLTLTQVTDSSASITWTSVAGAEAYRILRARYAPGPYTTFKEYYAPPFSPAPNLVTLTGLVEGDMYFLRVLSGTADGQFETTGSPIAVVIPTLGVRTGVNEGPPATSPLLETYDETFCRISWTRPGNGVTQTGPAASHFAVGYRCGTDPGPTLYPEEFTSTTATLHAPFVTARPSCI